MAEPRRSRRVHRHRRCAVPQRWRGRLLQHRPSDSEGRNESPDAGALIRPPSRTAQNGLPRPWGRDHLIHVVGQIAQSKSGRILRPVAARRNRRNFYCMARYQRGRDRRARLNLTRFHFLPPAAPCCQYAATRSAVLDRIRHPLTCECFTAVQRLGSQCCGSSRD